MSLTCSCSNHLPTAPRTKPFQTVVSLAEYFYLRHYDRLNLHITSCFHFISVWKKSERELYRYLHGSTNRMPEFCSAECRASPARSASEEDGCGGRHGLGWQAETARPGAMCFMTLTTSCCCNVFVFFLAMSIAPADLAWNRRTRIPANFAQIISFNSTWTCEREEEGVYKEASCSSCNYSIV